jgi:succinyl-CoA synthetase beta subunit
VPTLSEAASKELLARHGVPLLSERTAPDVDGAVDAARELGHPVVLKLCGDAIAHKTERGLVRLDLRDDASVREAATELLAAATPDDGPVEVLVAPMVRGTRELIAGVVHDAQFGACVMLGIGGVLAEAIADVSFRLVPITERDAHEMIDDLRSQPLLGPSRGEPPVDRGALVEVLVGLSQLAASDPQVRAIDLNPLVVSPTDGRPVPVDALVELA